MKVAYCSDAHFDIWFHIKGTVPTILNDCNADVLIVAGDMFEYSRWSKFFHQSIIEMLCDRFKHVIMIDGNHEFYNMEFESDDVYEILKDSPSNFKYLRNESITIDGVVFYGGTFWTNPNDWTPLERFGIPNSVSCFTYIKNMTFDAVTKSHNTFIENLNDTMINHPDNEIVVISHFPPTQQSIREDYRGNLISAYFANQYFEEFYESTQIKHWICGHVHHKHSFEIGTIQGHCNPIGYPREEIDFSLEHFDI